MQYNLFFSAENNYVQYLFVLCQSIINSLQPRSTDQEDEIVFNVIIDNSVDLIEAKNKAQRFTDFNNNSLVAFKFEWHEVDPSQFNECTPIIRDGKSSFSAYYRLCIEQFCAKNTEYAAYLDIDMLVLSDIRELFDKHPLTGKILGAVIDPCVINGSFFETDSYIHAFYKNNRSEYIKIPKLHYFNSGMLLINLKEWRKHDIVSKCFDIASKLILTYYDQDILNYVCLGHVELLDISWNLQTPMLYSVYNSESKKYDILTAITPETHWGSISPTAEDFEQSLAHPNIIHFTGEKPWNNKINYYQLHSYKAPRSPLHAFYVQQWRLINQQIPDPIQLHVANNDAVSTTDINVYLLDQKIDKFYKKLGKSRKIFNYSVILLLLLNLVSLLLILLR